MASEEARDSSRAQALKNVKTARAYSNWIRFFRRSANIRKQRVAGRYWGQLGSLNLPQHWARLGHRLRQHKKYLKTLQ